MTFAQWVDRQRKDSESIFSVLAPLVVKSGVSQASLYNAYSGIRFARYDTAAAVSKATGGKVKIVDLVKTGKR